VRGRKRKRPRGVRDCRRLSEDDRMSNPGIRHSQS
jgi:hypothetical protein